MQLACVLAIAFGLSFSAVGTASRHPNPADRPESAAQAPAAPAPAETTPNAPANLQTPAAGEKAPENVAKDEKEKTGSRKVSTVTTSGARKRRKRAPPAPAGAPRKIVVREGGASEPTAQIVPGMTPAEAARQRQNAEQLLKSTDEQLKQLAGRTLDAQRQETVGQIQNYVNGVHLALKEGDIRRASTLAEKAHLLSEDLVKQKH